MRVFLFIAAGLLLCSMNTDFDTQYRKNLKSYHLKGKVHTVVESSYHIEGEGANAKKIMDHLFIHEFDRAGNITTYINSGETGDTLEKQLCIYNERGILIRISSTGTRITDPCYSDIFYNEKGLLSNRISYSPDGKFISKASFEHDRQGRMTSVTVYNGSGATGERDKYRYDERGNIVLAVYNYPGQPSDSIIAKYDERHNEIERHTYMNGYPFTSAIMQFNEQNALIHQVIYDHPRKTHNTSANTYNTNGDLTNGKYYGDDDTTLEAENMKNYEYDRAGNWTKSTGRDSPLLGPGKHDDRVTVCERMITYY